MTTYTLAISYDATDTYDHGVLTTHTGHSTHYKTLEKLKERLHNILERHKKARRTALFYSITMHQDYHHLRPHDSRHHNIYSTSPFICDVIDDNGRIYGKYLNIQRLHSGTYSDLCLLMGERPHPHIPGFNGPRTQHTSELTMRYLQELKHRLATHGIKPRWLLSAGHIGMTALTKHLLEQPRPDKWFYDSLTREYHQTRHKSKILTALRGGRCQIFHHGTHPHSSHIDINSHYSNVLAHMPLPDLSTERLFTQPTYDILTHTIGISEVTIELPAHPYGLLGMHHNGKLYFPNTPGQRIIGAWTHDELRYALAHGARLHHIEWTLLWDEQPNTLHDYIHDIYHRRTTAATPLDKHFYKMFLNHTIGKFAQRLDTAEYRWSNRDNNDYYIRHGYTIINSHGRDNLYYKSTGELTKRSFVPILTVLVNGLARTQLLRLMERFQPDDLHYVDTDGLVVTTQSLRNTTFKYSNNLGDLKLTHDDVTYAGYAPKTYQIGTDIKLSGVPKQDITTPTLREGPLTYHILLTHKTARHDQHAGTYDQRERIIKIQDTYTNTTPLLHDDATEPEPHYQVIQ